MKPWLTLILVFIASVAGAQNIRRVEGTIKNTAGEPLEYVTVRLSGQKNAVTSNSSGHYSIPANNAIFSITYSITGYFSRTVAVVFTEGQVFEQDIVLQKDIRSLDEIKILANNLKPGGVNLAALRDFPTVNGNFESILKTLPGVSTNNELSSQYSVRGGNYDENLVYINDIEIYRPLLIRNGQQEGLSIVNPGLVGRVNFYPGGFESKYGDKLSSVLNIRYTKPDSVEMAASISNTQQSLTIKWPDPDRKGYMLVGGRIKNTRGILNGQEVKGSYNPEFYDLQMLINRDLHPKLSFALLGGYNYNQFTLVPASRETTYGTSQRYLRLDIDYEGKEADRYEIITGAVTMLYKPSERFNLKWMNSASLSNEKEAFDLTGFYRLEELTKKNSPPKDTLVIGSYRSYADNRLKSKIFSSEIRAYLQSKSSFWEAGFRLERDVVSDKLREFNQVDSAGNTLPYGPGDYINSDIEINALRVNAFLQSTYELGSGLTFLSGLRTNYSGISDELLWSPRITMRYRPEKNDRLSVRASAGWYNQPPFYRELRNYDGTIVSGQKAQRSFHLLSGADYVFQQLNTTFTFSSEVYYKFLNRLVPYKIDNLRIRYLAGEESNGYATGIDLNLSGQFVEGLESAFRLSLMKTAEDIRNDFYFAKNASGVSVRVEPGYLKRPTDQRLNFSVFFQDKLLQNPAYKVHLTMLYGSALPAGPPGKERYQDLFKIPAYRRVDIGFSKDFLDKSGKWKPGFIKKGFSSFSAFIEVFNLLNINNTVSYLWIKDLQNNSYAIPNYLTSRTLNFKIVAKFNNKD